MRWASDESAALGGRRHRVRRAGGPQALAGGNELRSGQALDPALQLVRGGKGKLAHLSEGLDPGLAGRPLGHHQHPDGLD